MQTSIERFEAVQEKAVGRHRVQNEPSACLLAAFPEAILSRSHVLDLQDVHAEIGSIGRKKQNGSFRLARNRQFGFRAFLTNQLLVASFRVHANSIGLDRGPYTRKTSFQKALLRLNLQVQHSRPARRLPWNESTNT